VVFIYDNLNLWHFCGFFVATFFILAFVAIKILLRHFFEQTSKPVAKVSTNFFSFQKPIFPLPKKRFVAKLTGE
jgi:hypothetical protein